MAYDVSNIFKKNENPSIHFNTGTIFDLWSGKLVKGYDGKYYINGGISNLTYLFHGRTHSYKSTSVDSLIANLLSIYRDMSAVVIDTENHKLDSERYDNLTSDGSIVSDRITISEKLYISEVLQKILEVDADRMKNKKDLMIESPFLNYKGDRIKSWILLPIFIDSLTELESKSEKELLRKHELEDSKLNMIFMNDGKRKKILSRAIAACCVDSGFSFFGSAHTGDEMNLDNPQAKPKKHSIYMKAGEKIKGMPKSSTYNAQIMIETNVSSGIDPNTKEPYYAGENEQTTNLNELNLFIQKGKNNVSGINCEMMVTQKEGIQNALSNFHFAKKGKTDGVVFSGKGHGFAAPCFMPDKTSSRNTIRKNLEESYELRRAFDLIAQMKYVKMFYDRSVIPVPVDEIDINKAAEKLLSTNSSLVTDILNSRGYWTYLPDDRPYMSVYDVFEYLHKNM